MSYTHTLFFIFMSILACSNEEYYLFSTGQCVSECPCGTTPYPDFCYEGILTMHVEVISFATLNIRESCTHFHK